MRSQFRRGMKGHWGNFGFSKVALEPWEALTREVTLFATVLKGLPHWAFSWAPAPLVAVSLSELFLYPASFSSGKSRLILCTSQILGRNSCLLLDLRIAVLSSWSASLMSTAWLTLPGCSGAQSVRLGPRQPWPPSRRSDVVPGLSSFTPTLKIHFKCYRL